MPESIRQAMAQRFGLAHGAVGAWQLLVRPGQHMGREVCFMRVFDPALVQTDSTHPLDFDSLLTGCHRVALMFEGLLEKDGRVYLADRRPPPSRQQTRPKPWRADWSTL